MKYKVLININNKDSLNIENIENMDDNIYLPVQPKIGDIIHLRSNTNTKIIFTVNNVNRNFDYHIYTDKIEYEICNFICTGDVLLAYE